jgi:hypothetical protein
MTGLPAAVPLSKPGQTNQKTATGNHAAPATSSRRAEENLRLVAALDRGGCVGRGRLCRGPCHLCRPIEGCEGLIESALNFDLIGDGLRELGLDSGALAGEAAAP